MNEVNAGELRQTDRQDGRTDWTDRQAGCRAKMDRQHNCLYSNNKPISEGGRNDSDSEIIRKTTEMSKNNLVASVGTGSILDYSDISWKGNRKKRERERERKKREKR